MVAEDQFRQNMEEFNPMAALLGMDVTLRREVHQERARINELNINITKTSIPSKRKLIRNKKKSSTYERLWKLWRTKTKRNLRGVDVQKRRDQSPQSQTRSTWKIQEAKRELEDELQSVKVKFNQMENDIKLLSEAKLAQEEKNMELQERLSNVSGKSWRVETKQ